ncbi:MAG: hypothetical protein ACI9EW_000507 [Cellvibrionaceae bacterium]
MFACLASKQDQLSKNMSTDHSEQTGTVLMKKKCMMCGETMAHGYEFCGRCGHELIDPYPAYLQKRQALRSYFKNLIFEVLIPVLAGIKTTWLIFVKPNEFFKTLFFYEKPADEIDFPLSNLWRKITNEPQYIYEPAPYWFFVLAFMTVAAILLRGSSVLTLGGRVAGNEAEFANGNLFFIVLRPMINRIMFNYNISDDLLELPFGLLYVLFVFFSTALLAFIYHRSMGRENLPSNHNYTFWLYFVGAMFIAIRIMLLLLAGITTLGTEGLLSLPGIALSVIGFGYIFIIYPLYMPIYVLSKLFSTISFNRALKVTIGTYVIYGLVMGFIYLVFTAFSWLPRLIG